jgi:hypothetical protein
LGRWRTDRRKRHCKFVGNIFVKKIIIYFTGVSSDRNWGKQEQRVLLVERRVDIEPCDKKVDVEEVIGNLENQKDNRSDNLYYYTKENTYDQGIETLGEFVHVDHFLNPPDYPGRY